MDTVPLFVAFAAMVPLMVYIIYTDLKDLRIPNWVVLAVLGVFIVTGLWGLPFDTFLWRLLYGVIALVLGFGLYAIAGGKVGGGDMKLIAVLIPFITPGQVLFVLVVYTLVTIIGLIGHRIIRRMLKGREIGWKALDQKIYFPVGLILGLTILIYLGSEVLDRIYYPEA